MTDERRAFAGLLMEFAKLNEKMGFFLALNEPKDSERKTNLEEKIRLTLHEIDAIADRYIKNDEH